MSRRIWLDMTDLTSWSGHMTGIQRVVYLNAKQLYETAAEQAHFFVFHDTFGTFEEVNFADIQERIERERDRQTDVSQPPYGPRRTIAGFMRSMPRAVVRRIPAKAKEAVPPEIKQALKGGYRLGVGLARRSKKTLVHRFRAAPAPEFRKAEFMSGDTVLILGKSWDLPDMIPALGRLKMTHGFRLVHLVHDMIPTLQPHCFGPGLFEPYTRTLFEACSLADGILAQSKATARDVKRFCAMLLIPCPPIRVVRLGDEILDIPLPPDEPAPHPRIKRGAFVLQVGTIETRKNHLLVYLAYREAALRGIDLPTWVVIGSQGWLVGDLIWQMTHDPVVKDKIVLLGGVSDRVKLWLFRNCRFTVYPSTYEGFGMPVSESLAYGKVCITSKTSSLPEAGGDYADLVSPYNTEEMLQALLRYCDDEALAAREKQISNYRPASWEENFRQIMAFVEEVSR